MEKEIWKDIPGYEGLYQASNLGRIRSLIYNKVHILKTSNTGSGYYKVNLYLNKVMKSPKVHKLVWTTFNGPIPEGLEINHHNEKKNDNSLTNLELVTRKENNNFGTRTESSKTFKKTYITIQFTRNFHTRILFYSRSRKGIWREYKPMFNRKI